MTVDTLRAVAEVRTSPLGGPPLTRALLAGDPRVHAWYPDLPTTAARWVRRAVDVRGASAHDWLSGLWPAIEAQGPAAIRLRRAAEHGVVVTTGQQPGLFGGPIYTWSKAISAIALADALEAACGIPVAPVFWAATDDSDQREARSTWIAIPGGAEQLTAPGSAPDGTIMSAVPLGDISAALDRLVAATGSATYGEPLAALSEAYHQGATVGGAYVALLRRILEPMGMAVLDASHPAVRHAAYPVLRQALMGAAEVERAVARRTQAIVDAGYEPKVADVSALSLVFHYRGDVKQRVPIAGATAAAEAADDTSLSPNVLLRPLVEATILPTVAYLAGPSEIAYFAQVGAVAGALGRPAPLAVPRWSTTIVEPHVERLLRKRGLTPDDFRDPHEAEQRFARAALPTVVRESLEAVRQSLESGIKRVEQSADGLGVSERAFGGALFSMGFKLDRLERRLMVAVKRAERDAITELGTLRGALYPDGIPQERALSFIPLLARHGPALLDAMREAAGRHATTLVGG